MELRLETSERILTPTPGPRSKLIVNFGCGPSALPGYLNIDGSLSALLSRLPVPASVFGSRSGAVRAMRAARVKYSTAKALRLAEASLDGFYASHVLEHVSRDECADLLRRVWTWLKPAGVLRIVLPDLRLFARQYMSGVIEADRFIRILGLAVDGSGVARLALGHTQHRWMYDAESAARLLKPLGYVNIAECKSGQTAMEEFAVLDASADRAVESFYLEATR